MLTLDFVRDISAVDPGFGKSSATSSEVGIGVVWTLGLIKKKLSTVRIIFSRVTASQQSATNLICLLYEYQ